MRSIYPVDCLRHQTANDKQVHHKGLKQIQQGSCAPADIFRPTPFPAVFAFLCFLVFFSDFLFLRFFVFRFPVF